MNFDLQAWVVRLALKTTCGHYKNLVPDADLEIRGARSSRPLDKRRGGGDGGLHKFYFGSSGLSLVEKYGGLGPPGPPPPPPRDPPLEFHSHLNTNSIDSYLISTP